MIDSKNVLVECLQIEEELYKEIGYKNKLHSFITQCEVGKIMAYMRILRKDEYYTNKKNKSILDKVFALICRRRHNQLGCKLGLSIPVNTFGKGLLIYHSQGIIVHKDARCGEYCKLHGNNCIGNKGSEENERTTPIIGDGLDLGVGAVIIGGIVLGNNMKVAANAVVCKSFEKENGVLAGVPAKLK